MTSNLIQARYEEVARIAQRFDARAEATRQLQQQLLRSMQKLRSGGWQGKGSTAFYSEMERTVLPALQRLNSAFIASGKTTRQIAQILRVAEEEAARLFVADALRFEWFGNKEKPAAENITAWEAPPPDAELGIVGPGDDRAGDSTDRFHPNDIAQGQIGDCYVVAAIAAIAQQNPN